MSTFDVSAYQKAHQKDLWSKENKYEIKQGDSVSHALMTNKSLFDSYKERAGNDNIDNILNLAVNEMTINGKKVQDTNGDGKINWKDANQVHEGDKLVFGENEGEKNMGNSNLTPITQKQGIKLVNKAKWGQESKTSGDSPILATGVSSPVT